MTQDQPLLAVQEALRKCFPVVEEQQGLWQSALRDCPPLLASLSNLAEQLQAAQNLRFEDVPSLRAFPDLQERLRRKQLAAGDTLLDRLEERLKVPEEEVPSVLNPVGRLGKHPSFAQSLGPNFGRRTPRPCTRYPVECFLLPGRVKKPCVYRETRGTQLKTDIAAL
eukprot:bmy_02122T0